jgi:hypothetical protein
MFPRLFVAVARAMSKIDSMLGGFIIHYAQFPHCSIRPFLDFSRPRVSRSVFRLFCATLDCKYRIAQNHFFVNRFFKKKLIFFEKGQDAQIPGAVFVHPARTPIIFVNRLAFANQMKSDYKPTGAVGFGTLIL